MFLKEREPEMEFLEVKIKSSETKNILNRLRVDQMLQKNRSVNYQKTQLQKMSKIKYRKKKINKKLKLYIALMEQY